MSNWVQLAQCGLHLQLPTGANNTKSPMALSGSSPLSRAIGSRRPGGVTWTNGTTKTASYPKAPSRSTSPNWNVGSQYGARGSLRAPPHALVPPHLARNAAWIRRVAQPHLPAVLRTRPHTATPTTHPPPVRGLHPHHDLAALDANPPDLHAIRAQQRHRTSFNHQGPPESWTVQRITRIREAPASTVDPHITPVPASMRRARYLGGGGGITRNRFSAASGVLVIRTARKPPSPCDRGSGRSCTDGP